MWLYFLAAVAVVWFIVVVLVSALGVWKIHQAFSKPHAKPFSSTLPPTAAPHVTIIRPVKGVDPYLWECLASSFELAYPAAKLSVALCVASASDPALPLLRRIIERYPTIDGRVYIEEDDAIATAAGPEAGQGLGPNPKIRNMSRAYREAPPDAIVWILDCNVWVHRDTLGLLIDRLCGLGPGDRTKYKFVHHLPLVVDVSHRPYREAFPDDVAGSDGLGGRAGAGGSNASWGGRIEELFLCTAHAKFYTAIATAAVAPCTNGKSTLFRRAHLDALTQPSASVAGNLAVQRGPGIDRFSDNICEDHLISDLLWRQPVPAAVRAAAADEGRDLDPTAPTAAADADAPLRAAEPRWGKHALLLAPPAVQPVRDVSVAAYAARRARWLRVRKFTVPAATAVEPGTELLVLTALGTAGLRGFGWAEAADARHGGLLFLVGFAACTVAAWMSVDRWVWGLLRRRLRADGVPWAVAGAASADGKADGMAVGFGAWLGAWAGREVLALPVWLWAIFGGNEVRWRGKRFWVGVDMRVHEIEVPQAKKHV